MRFTLQLDIINHCDISVLAFYNDWDINLMINIYSDNNQTTLQVLCQNMANIDNTVILTEDFNIREIMIRTLISNITLYTLTTSL